MFNKKEYDKKYYEKNKEHILVYIKEWQKDNPGCLFEYKKQWRAKNKEKILKYSKEHKEHISEYNKKYYEENREKLLEDVKSWRKTKEGKASSQRHTIKRRAELKEILNTLTANEWLDILEEHNYKCIYCGKDLLNSLDTTRDHVIPISKGGNNTKDNIVPSCQSCNSKKSNKILNEG